MKKIKFYIKRFFSKKGIDYPILIAAIVLIIFGIIMIGSASIGSVGNVIRDSSGEAILDELGNIKVVSEFYPLKNMIYQGAFALTGAVLMYLFTKAFKVEHLTYHTVLFIYFLGILAMLLCLFWEIKGARAWIRFPGFTIQPAEFMKLGMTLILAYFFSDRVTAFKLTRPMQTEEMRQKFLVKKFNECLVKPFCMIGIVFVLCAFVQNDLGTGLILGAVCGICFLVAPGSYYKKYQKMILSAAVVLFALGSTALLSNLKSHQIQRFEIWQNPLEDPYNSSFQLINSLIAFSNGGIFGRGFNQSVQKYDYIPESHNDFIGSIAYEELGIFGLAAIVIPTAVIVFRLLYYADKIQNDKSRIILCGISSYFLLHLFVNLGGVSGLIPMTGVPILLVSYGGSSTWSALISLGVAQAIISRYNISLLKEEPY